MEPISQSVNPSMDHSSIYQPDHPIIQRSNQAMNEINQEAKGQDGVGRPSVPPVLVALLSHLSWSPYCPTRAGRPTVTPELVALLSHPCRSPYCPT